MFRTLRPPFHPRSAATNVRLFHRPKTAVSLLGSSSSSRRNSARTSSLRNRATPCSSRSFGTTTSKGGDKDEPELRLEDDGEYDIILPQDPTPRDFPTLRPVPVHIPRPPYASIQSLEQYRSTGKPVRELYMGDGRVRLGGEEEKNLREAARLARRVLQMAGTLVQEGVTTEEIDAKVHDYIVANGAYPSPLHYDGFPKSCCTSVNNIIAHGIPDGRPLKNGDIVNIDITVYFKGYHGDTSKTFLVGDVDPIGRDLVKASEDALRAGIDACGPGRHFRDIAKAIHSVLKGRDFTICSGFTGHGIGQAFHRPPWILHDVNEEPGLMMPGHCFTIEPCVNKGSNDDYMVFPDDWTASTTNWARSAQAEHMVLITESGADVLTAERVMRRPYCSNL